MAACPLVDLPDVLLEVILRSCFYIDRGSLARTCRCLRRVHDECRWTFARCSMRRLLRRGRYCETPHWTSDFAAMRRVFHRPNLQSLRHLVLLLDVRCFDVASNPWVHPDRKLKLALPALESLELIATRHGKARPSPHVVQRIVEACPRAHSVHLQGIRKVGTDAIKSLLQKSRPLRRLVLRDCDFTETCRRTLVQRMASPPEWDDFLGLAWPHTLRTLELTGSVMSECIRTVSRLLYDQPMNLPMGVRYLDMNDTLGMLHDYQIVVTVSILTSLEELVVGSHFEGALDVLEAYQPRLFPEVKLRILL